MRKSIVQCIKHHKASGSPHNVAILGLHNDIINCVAHDFGEEYYCTKDKNDNGELKKIQNSTFIFRMNAIISNVAAKSRSLVEDVDTNTVECFNSVIAKFIGVKRTNYALKGGYQGRCSAAVVSFNCKSALSAIQKALNKSPKGRVKIIERRSARKRKLNLEHPVKTYGN
ncbi:unnamed protein product [Parnassius apollo]|uniref:(apollo) hypothetical protein n=1 Tax=Parnassius apollo TaxID=110799 RepID=A0A8S3WN03_PARAO|nr:unnamed protein product [Parnassius apollo]